MHVLSWTAVLVLFVTAYASNEAFHQRDIFYIGGQYVYNPTLGGTILTSEQYVEKLTPAGGVHQKYPLLLVHSGGPSGTVLDPEYDMSDADAEMGRSG